MFGSRFQEDAPNPKNEDDKKPYIEALTYLFIATARAPQDEGLPGMAAIIEAGKVVASDLESPLDDIPVEWTTAALEASKAWMDCYGQAK